MIEGINIRCNVGGVEVLRSPRIVLTLRRRAVVSTCEVDIPDADGQVQASLAKKQAVRVRFGHRGEGGTWHDWSGLLFFFPICLLGLAAVHSLLAGELIWKPSRRKKLVVKMNKSH